MRNRKEAMIILCGLILLLTACGQPPAIQEPTPQVEQLEEPAPAILEPIPTRGEYSWNQTPTPLPPITLPTPPLPTPTSIPSSPDIELESFRMMDTRVGFARIDHEQLGQRLMRTEDGGNTWTDITPPDGPDANLSYYFYDSSCGWISYRATSDGFSSESYTIWRTTDGGNTWDQSAPMDLSDIDAEGVYPATFSFLSRQVGWFRAVVGPYGMNQAPLTLYRTMDGGRTWQRIADPYTQSNMTSFSITGMVFADTSYGWVTRDSNGVEAYAAVQITEDGGATWTSISLPEPADSPGLFGSGNWCATRHPRLTGRGQGSLVVWCKDYGSGGATYHSYRYTTRDGGATWTIQDIPSGTFFAFPDALIVASSANRDSDQTAVHASRNDGASWQSHTIVDFYTSGWDFVDPLHGWVRASWDDGRRALMHTSDGGLTWTELDSSCVFNLPSGRELQNLQITSISMSNTRSGWAVGAAPGDNDRILVTTNGGERWIDVTPPEPLLSTATDIAALGYFLDSQHAWVTFALEPHSTPASVSIWRTSDGGRSWVSSPLPDIANLIASYSPYHLFFLDADHGWFMAALESGMQRVYSAVYTTSDGGASWTRILDPSSDTNVQLFDKTGMVFADASHGWITYDGRGVEPGLHILITGDGGVSWSPSSLPEPSGEAGLFGSSRCGTYSPVMNSGTTGSVIGRCSNYAGDAETVVEYLYTTSDGGATWQYAPYPGGSFIQVNPMVLYALSEDMYRSDDGGLSWNLIKMVSWTGQFSFVDEDLGWAVATAEEDIALVRTEDGGLNWQLIEYEVFEQE